MNSPMSGAAQESHSGLILPSSVTGGIDPNTPVMGPGSLAWENTGRRYNLLTAVAFGIVETMHPEISANLMNPKKSNFFDDPLDRLFRSRDPILGAVYDPQPDVIGEWVRDQHKDINTPYTDKHGDERVARALGKDPFSFAQFTFHMMVETGTEKYNPEATRIPHWKELLLQGSRVWYSRYGVSMASMPANYADFEEQWDDALANKVEMTPAAQRTINRMEEGDIGRPPQVPATVWRVIHKPISHAVKLFAIDGIPDVLCERFDIPPLTPREQDRLEDYEKLIRTIFPLLPDQVAYFKRARDGKNAPDRQKPVTYDEAVAL